MENGKRNEIKCMPQLFKTIDMLDLIDKGAALKVVPGARDSYVFP